MMDWRILLSGLPGRMARETALTILGGPDKDNLLPFALTSSAHHGEFCEFEGGTRLELISDEVRDLQTVAERLVAIDFSTPAAALPNAEWFCSRQIPFVMGTTGGDEIAMRDLVEQSQTCAVIAANTAAPIVLLLEAVDYLAREFPRSLEGHRLRIQESHQAAKRDTSGTARAMLRMLNKLGLQLRESDIEKLRDPERQRSELGVPPEHIDGHAYHDYTVATPDNSMQLGLQHRVHGRGVYARGALHAAHFLGERIDAGERGRVYSMIDVLRG